MEHPIFISYRRDDSEGYTRAILGALREKLGDWNLFVDVDSIEPGIDFVERIEAAIAKSKVLILVIGDKWLAVTDESGKRRLDDSQDFVRLELSSAIEHGILILPVLVGNSTMPTADELPDELRDLSRINAVSISNEHFESGVNKLIAVLKKHTLPRAAFATSWKKLFLLILSPLLCMYLFNQTLLPPMGETISSYGAEEVPYLFAVYLEYSSSWILWFLALSVASTYYLRERVGIRGLQLFALLVPLTSVVLYGLLALLFVGAYITFFVLSNTA